MEIGMGGKGTIVYVPTLITKILMEPSMNKINFLLVPVALLIAANAYADPPRPPGPPVSEPVDANVLNFPSVQTVDGTVDVSNFPAVQTVDGTVSVSNFPQNSRSPFSRSCTAVASECTIDLTNLSAMGEVHLTQVSGQAQNVGTTASPRFFNGGSPEVLLPPTVNTADTGDDRDILFSQSMDLIPVSSFIRFLEPGSTNVFFYVSGYVVASPVASAAAARDAGVPVRSSSKSP